MKKLAVEIRDLSFCYEDGFPLLEKVNFDITEGSILTILGQNGTGKTTLLNCLMGFIDKYSGDIYLYGKRQQEYSRKNLASLIGFVPQLSQISFDYTVKEFILMGCTSGLSYFSMPNKANSDYVEQTMGMLGIENLSGRYVNSLSGGERQLVYIARALAQKTRIIILDEPTSALDFGNTFKIVDLLCKLKDMGYAVVLTCHNPDFALLFKDKSIAMMPDHHIIYGESENILSDELLSELYGIPMKRLILCETNQYVCVRA